MEAKVGWAAALLIVPVLALVHVVTAVDSLPVRGASFWVVAWGAALLGAAVYVLLTGAGPVRGIGLALMLTPVATTLLGIANSLDEFFAGGPPPPPFTTYQLSGFYSRKFLIQVGYPVAGFILWSGWRPDWTLRDLARRLSATGLPIGRSEGRSALAGWLFFPVLLFGTLAVNIVLSQQVPSLDRAGDGPYVNMTVYHSILLSASAALGEEIVYRGLFMVGGFALLRTAGQRLAMRLDAPRLAAMDSLYWVVAWVVQAVVFGFAHASFNNPLLVVQATLFGLISGFAALRFGILCAVMLHFLIDIYAFGADVGGLWISALVMLLIVNTGATLVGGAWWAAGRLRRSSHSED